MMVEKLLLQQAVTTVQSQTSNKIPSENTNKTSGLLPSLNKYTEFYVRQLTSENMMSCSKLSTELKQSINSTWMVLHHKYWRDIRVSGQTC